MLSRLIVTFLCAAAIGSVSGVFLTFDPKPIEFEDIEVPISFSAKLKSKPTEAVTVYFEHPSMSMSTSETFDDLEFSFNKPGWYNMAFTRDIKVQVFRDKCTAELSCIKKVLARYGSSVVSLDVSGPAKSLREYSVTEVTQNTNGHTKEDEVDAYAKSWRIPEKPQPNPVIPVPTMTTTTTTTTTTTMTTTTDYI
ncbi:hypothetical protein BASA60_007986 [Batrachochytrium salamandrivorans]|nr:hypothetical protein BASA60_007986 [Batrachochytrium salamandrivorans]